MVKYRLITEINNSGHNKNGDQEMEDKNNKEDETT